MNNGVICGNCNTENASGAKFCVHCGRSIRTAPVQICSNCQSENAAGDSVCKQCGALLPGLADGLGNSGGFTGIPSQDPDDDGPAAMPDEAAEQESNEEIDWTAFGQQDQPSHDSNFPDWLLDDEALRPTDEAADPFSSEASPDRDDSPKPDSWAADEPDNADLPAWVGAADDDDDEPETPAEEADIGDSLEDWLAELGEPSDLDFTESPAADADDAGSSEAGERAGRPKSDPLEWLSEFGSLNTDILSMPISEPPEEEEEEADADSLEAWMNRIGHAETGFLSDPAEDLSESDDEPVRETVSEPPNWAVELGLTDTGGFSINEEREQLPADDTEADEPAALPPWLEDNDKTSILPELAELRDAQLEEDEDEEEADLPEWLTDAEEIEDETRMTGYLPSEPKFDLESDEDEELPDWLEGIDEKELVKDAPSAAPPTRTLSPKGVLLEQDEAEEDVTTPGGGVTLPPWINTEELSDEDEEASELAAGSALSMGGAELPPWLTGTEPDEPEPAAGSQQPESQLPDWVNDYDEIELPDEEEAPGAEFSAEPDEDEADMPEWLTEPDLFEISAGQQPDQLEEDTDEDTQLPDWLISSHDDVLTDEEAEPEEPELAADEEEAAIPGWLSEPGFDAVELPAAADQADEDADEPEAALPDWLSAEDDQDSGSDESTQEQFGEEDEAQLEAAESDEEEMLLDELGAPSTDSIESDWLMSFEDPDGDEEVGEEDAADGLPDWMAESDAEPAGDEEEFVESELDSDWLLPEPVESDGMAQLQDESDSDELEPDLSDSELAVDLNDLAITELDTDFGFTAWLSDLGEDEEEEELVRGTDLLDDLLVADPNIIKSELGWLEDVTDDDTPLEESTHGIAPLTEDEFISEAMASADAADEVPLTDQPEWLTAWESSGGKSLEPVEEEEIPELEEDIFAKLEESAEVEPASLELAEEEPLAEAAAAAAAPDLGGSDDDWLLDGMLPSDGLEPGEIPDWLEQMEPVGDSDGVPTPKGDEVEPAADLPDWIADLKPTRESDMDSILPSALPLVDEADSLEEISEDLAAEQLPQWLQVSERPAEGEDVLTMPLAAEREVQTGWRDALFQDSDAGPDDWEEILGDLPPSVSPEEALAKAEIPEWVQQLMPPVLKGEPEEVVEAAAEETGPLAGLSGVIGTAAIPAVMLSNEPLDPFKISKEQKQQAALLRQLTRAERQPAQVELETIQTTSTWTRIILAGVLFIAVAAGLLLPDLLQVALPSAQVQPAEALIEAAAGRPVLVAFEYTPAMAGELSPQAEALLGQLQMNGSPVATVSQYSTGMALAQELTAGMDVSPVGLITGEAIGLRQLGDCLGEEAQCQRILGRPLDAKLQDQLQDVQLIILLTAEHDSLVNWIEQVGSSSEVPMIAGITQSLMPSASPYLESGQLQAAISGIYEAAALQNSANDSGLVNRVQAVGFGQLAAALLLLIGVLFVGPGGKKTGKPTKTKSST